MTKPRVELMSFDHTQDPFLSQFSSEAVHALLSRSTEHHFQPGETLIVEGEASECVYLLLEGEIEIFKGDVSIDRQEREGTFGEMGVITASPRSTTVRAYRRVRALKIPAEAFLETVDACPQLLRRICHELSDKLRASQTVRQEQQLELIQVQETFERCVSASVLEQIMQSASPEALLEGSVAEAAILFFDIRGFTEASEAMSPKLLLGALNSHLEAMVESVLAHGGVINNFIGDAVLAVFNCPIPSPVSTQEALSCALDCVQRIEALHQEQALPDDGRFKFGIGLNFGTVVAGAVGSPSRFSYTVLGDPVNLAARLEGLTRHYPVSLILSDSFIKELPAEEAERCFLLDRITVKGRQSPIRIYSLWQGPESARQSYEVAIERYLSGHFEEAYDLFRGEERSELHQLMARRCRALLDDEERRASWPGYYRWSSK